MLVKKYIKNSRIFYNSKIAEYFTIDGWNAANTKVQNVFKSTWSAF